MKVLPDIFYTTSNKKYFITMTLKELKELLLSTNGEAIIRGRIHDIKSKNLGAGVYKVYVSQRHKDGC